jgi:hypothetical protein
MQDLTEFFKLKKRIPTTESKLFFICGFVDGECPKGIAVALKSEPPADL